MSRHGSNYPPELRERAVRMVAEVTGEYPLEWAAIAAVASKLGIGSTETLRKWCVGPRSIPAIGRGHE
jgi:transposase